MSKFSEHSFYCIKCGKKMMGLPRPKSHNHNKHHRKKLWCPWCKMEINGIECRTDEEVYEFKQAFELGEFQAEVVESLEHTSNETNLLWG